MSYCTRRFIKKAKIAHYLNSETIDSKGLVFGFASLADWRSRLHGAQLKSFQKGCHRQARCPGTSTTEAGLRRRSFSSWDIQL
jgi:hypothetical protein